MMSTKDSSDTVNQNPRTLRLVWPQWQGAGVESIREFFSEVPFEEARRGYAVGAAVLNAVLPAHSGPTALVPVESGDLGLGKQDGIEAKEAVVAQLATRRWAKTTLHYAAYGISGDPAPSECDIRLTRTLAEGAKILQINMLDHVVIGRPCNSQQGYFSFKEAGVL